MKKSKLQIILEALQEAGSTGCHSFELNNKANTIRSAARVMDLKEMGYEITATPEKMGNAHGVRYFLNKKQPIQTNIQPSIQAQKEKKVIKWEFDLARNVAIPIYA